MKLYKGKQEFEVLGFVHGSRDQTEAVVLDHETGKIQSIIVSELNAKKDVDSKEIERKRHEEVMADMRKQAPDASKPVRGLKETDRQAKIESGEVKLSKEEEARYDREQRANTPGETVDPLEDVGLSSEDVGSDDDSEPTEGDKKKGVLAKAKDAVDHALHSKKHH